MVTLSIGLISLSIGVIFNCLNIIGCNKRIDKIASCIKGITDEIDTLNKRIKGITDDIDTLNKCINSSEKNNKISKYENQ